MILELYYSEKILRSSSLQSLLSLHLNTSSGGTSVSMQLQLLCVAMQIAKILFAHYMD